MSITRTMLGAADDILLKRGLMLSGEMLEEIYDAMESRRRRDDYHDGDTDDVLLAKLQEAHRVMRQALELLSGPNWLAHVPTVTTALREALGEGK